MGQDTIALTRRRFLGAVTTVGVAGAGAGAGTTALFSDAESDSGELQSGTLNLTLDGQDASVTLLSEADIAPGDSGTASLTLTNTGSITGYVDIAVASATSYENGCNNNEKAVDDSCGDPGPGEGELEEYLELKASLGSQDLWGGNWKTPVEIYQDHGTEFDLDHELSGGASDDFVVDWRLQCSNCDVVQSDSFEFTLTFSLDQQEDSGA